MADAVRSTTPTITVTVDTNNETLAVTVTNPAPTSGRPDVTTNRIFRRPTGSSGVWTLAGTTGKNGTFTDLFLRSNSSFDYFARTDSEADSATATGTVPTVTGFWMYQANDPSTVLHFPFTDGTGENLETVEQTLQFTGRVYPIIESGIQETQTFPLNVTIPFYDLTWREQVEWWRLRKRARQTLLYRDGRGRVIAGRILGGVTITPTRVGATVTCSLTRIDYSASTVTIDPTYYTGGVYNDFGNGVSGNGNIGNGY